MRVENIAAFFYAANGASMDRGYHGSTSLSNRYCTAIVSIPSIRVFRSRARMPGCPGARYSSFGCFLRLRFLNLYALITMANGPTIISNSPSATAIPNIIPVNTDSSIQLLLIYTFILLYFYWLVLDNRLYSLFNG